MGGNEGGVEGRRDQRGERKGIEREGNLAPQLFLKVFAI